MIKFSIAEFLDVDQSAKDIDTFVKLGEKAWSEIVDFASSNTSASLPEGLSSEYEPDVRSLINMASSGSVVVFTAKNNLSQIIGMQVWFVHRDAFNATTKRATMQVVYIEKEFRSGGTITNFLSYACNELKAKGYNTYIGATPGTAMDLLIKKMRLKPTFIEYRV